MKWSTSAAATTGPTSSRNWPCVLFPLNPALVWVERRLCAERELACDDRVLHSGSGRKAYALCLTRLAEYSLVRRGFGLVLGAWEDRPELVRRVQRILYQPARTMKRWPALAATGGLVAGALACALTLARAPEVVRFAPPQLTSAQMAASLDIGQVSRALGGKPEMVKAIMPAGPASQPHSIPKPSRNRSARQRIGGPSIANRPSRAWPASELPRRRKQKRCWS